MTTTDDFDIDDQLATHLRRTLHAVAETVTDDSLPPLALTPARPPATRRSRRRLAITIAATFSLAACGLIAWRQLEPGEIERIPTETALMAGTAEDGTDWWLIPSAAIHPSPSCDPLTAAVELVSEASNKPGHEWNTGGVVYGEVADPTRSDSCYNEAGWLANPARFEMGATRLGDNDDPNSAWGYFAAVHPTITQVRVTADQHLPFIVETGPLPERPEGPRFFGFTVPPDTRNVTVDLLTADGTTVIEWNHSPT